ncbi:MAG: glycosyltransferase family 4 protein [Desulfatirhabdiaceae bacterium]
MANYDRLPRIAVIIPTYGRVGGAENVAYQLCERLIQKNQFDIHVLAQKWAAPGSLATFHAIPVWPFPRWVRPISFAAFAKNAVRRGRYDLVHSHERVFDMDVLSFHGIPHRRWVQNIRKKHMSLFDHATAWVESCGIQSAHTRQILPVSSLVQKALLQTYPLCQNKVRIFHPGASIAQFEQIGQDSETTDFRKHHGIGPTDVVMLFVGMNFEVKRLDLVIRAMADLGPVLAEYRVRLLVVGKGNESPYRNLASRLGIADRVIFAGVSHHMAQRYWAGDFLVMPSRMDTFGLVVLEAMAAGLPAIISGRVGAADLIVTGGNGLILSDDPSVSELRQAMMSLLDRTVRIRMGHAAKETAKTHDWDAVADKLADIYRELLVRKKALFRENLSEESADSNV